jgi:hypothetical protein
LPQGVAKPYAALLSLHCALTCTAVTAVQRPPRKKTGPDKSGSASSPLAKALLEERALEAGGEASAELTAFFKRMMRP